MVTKKKPTKKVSSVAATKKDLKKTMIVATKKKVARSVSKKKAVATVKKIVKKTPIVLKTKKSAKGAKTIAAVKKTILGVKKTAAPRKHQISLKRVTYMALSIILGLLLGTVVRIFIELVYIKNNLALGHQMRLNHFMGSNFYLPVAVEALFLLAGLCFGVWLGFWGWQTVYVEHKHRMFRK